LHYLLVRNPSDATEREFAYFYREYVIENLNEDKPLADFICEQLAGDEMAQFGESHELTSERIEQLTATGFLRMAPQGTASKNVDRELAANAMIAVLRSLLGWTARVTFRPA
jgi:hypothetical protein